MVVVERHAVDHPMRLPDHTNLHNYTKTKPSASRHIKRPESLALLKVSGSRSLHQRSSVFDMTTKKHGWLARDGSENGRVPFAT